MYNNKINDLSANAPNRVGENINFNNKHIINIYLLFYHTMFFLAIYIYKTQLIDFK